MFNLTGSEIIVILLLALVVLGPEKLPDAIRKFSQTYAELKKMGTGFQSELKSVLDEPMQEMRDTAALIQDAADPAKIAERAEKEAEEQAAADKAAAAERSARQAKLDSEHSDDDVAADSEVSNDGDAHQNGDGPNDDGAPGDNSDTDDRPNGVSDPGSTTVAVAESPAEPINQIAAANARTKIEPEPANDPGDSDESAAANASAKPDEAQEASV